MKNRHVIRLSETKCAIADLCEYTNPETNKVEGWLITRINVPEDFRGLGHGRKLLKKITDEADEKGVNLFLEINPYGEMTYDELRDWYLRYGFKEIITGFFQRRPNHGIRIKN